MIQTSSFPDWHGTTILAVRKNGRTVIAGDGQVSMGPTIVKGAARKVRTLAGGKVLAGFAGATADALTLIERLEAKLEQYPDQLARACVELAKDWRTDRYLRRLEAISFFKTEFRKHAQIANWNLASVYRIGSALLALFRTPSTKRPAKSSTSFKQKQSNKDHAPVSSSVDKFAMFDRKRVNRTPEEWEASQKASQEHNRSALHKLKDMLRAQR